VNRSPLEQQVLERIRPSPAERNHVEEIAGRIIQLFEERGVSAMVVGSVARHTWVSGDRDLDIFMLFDPGLPREELERKGLSLAREVTSLFGAVYREKYAEHPYINACIEEIDVDLVPCYRVENARTIQSAVDRTPFHTRYIQERIEPYIDDVLLIKQFSKAGGVYGSDQMTEGFSGYLTELLILTYGGFIPVLESASQWRPGTVIDPEGHRAKEFDEPLVVIDPVDPERNVSASVSLTRMYEFVELARGYLASPTRSFFFPPEQPPGNYDEFVAERARRGTPLYALRFATPPFIEDIVVPQLRKSTEAVCDLLERHGFSVNRADYCMRSDECMLIFELLVDRVPTVKRHAGPPLWNRANAEKFAAKYQDNRIPSHYSGPYIEDGCYMVEIARRFTCAADLLRSHEVLDVGLGKHVKQSMIERWDLDEGDACWHEEYHAFLSAFFLKSSPLVRIRRSDRGDTGDII
jgi:tRNA nucleotidyltransferase (CCA-adding enzyme)